MKEWKNNENNENVILCLFACLHETIGEILFFFLDASHSYESV
jgi:hypothetical protein